MKADERLETKEEKICPRCGKAFICQAKAIVNCFCTRYAIDAETSEYIRGKYAGCLCAACLQELSDKQNLV